MRHINPWRGPRLRSTAFASLLLAFVGAGALGAQERLLSLDMLAQRADVVLVGDCTQVRSFWNPSHTMIFTEVSHRAVAPEMVFKGSLTGDTHSFIRPGGQVDNLRTLVPHQPGYELNQRSLLFLYEQSRIRLYGTVNGYVGRLPVRVDPKYEREYVQLWQGPDGKLYPGAVGQELQPIRVGLSELIQRMQSIVDTEPEVN